MINDYFKKLPTSINGRDIRTDFRVWIKFGEIMESSRLDFEKEIQIKKLIYKDNIPSLTTGDIDLLVEFHSCKISGDGEIPKEILLDLNEDGYLIYQAFLKVYGIDLSEVEYMHWWKFNALLRECINGTSLGNVVQLRGIDLSEIKDEARRSELAKMKNHVFIGYNKR